MDISPEHFVTELLGYQRTAALKAAIELDLFTALSDMDGDLGAAAERTGASERGLRILCDYLTVTDFLEKEGGRYRPTPSSQAFLVRTSPAYCGSIIDFLAAPEMMRLWLADPAAFVRQGGSAGLANLSQGNPIWITFARAMAPFVRPVAAGVAAAIAASLPRPRHLLDIAAGHGLYGILAAERVPELEVTALDWPAVLAVARENAAAAGVASRYRTVGGSAFEVDWGRGYDLVLIANFLHHFDRETCVGLLVRAREALAPHGRVLAVEYVPNEDRVTPRVPAMFAFMMLGSSPSGDAYTRSEFESMGRQAGFARVAFEGLGPRPQVMVSFEA